MNGLLLNYILAETLTSVIINTAFSCAFFCLQFHSFVSVPWMGHGGLVRDSLPQTFAVALMSVLVPTLITRGRGARGALPNVVRPRRFVPSGVVIRAIGIAVIAALCGFAVTSVVFGHDRSDWSFKSALFFKCGYGAVVALIVTPVAVWMALHDAALTKTEQSRN